MKRSILNGAVIAVPFLVGGVASARYLQPEPMLSGPMASFFIGMMAQEGHGVSSPYSYALNNPIHFTDIDGRYAWTTECESALAGWVCDIGPISRKAFCHPQFGAGHVTWINPGNNICKDKGDLENFITENAGMMDPGTSLPLLPEARSGDLLPMPTEGTTIGVPPKSRSW